MCSNDTYFDAIDNCDASKNLVVFPEMERRVVIRRAVNGDRGSLPGGENGKRLMVTEQGGEQLLLRTLLIIQSLPPSLIWVEIYING